MLTEGPFSFLDQSTATSITFNATGPIHWRCDSSFKAAETEASQMVGRPFVWAASKRRWQGRGFLLLSLAVAGASVAAAYALPHFGQRSDPVREQPVREANFESHPQDFAMQAQALAAPQEDPAVAYRESGDAQATVVPPETAAVRTTNGVLEISFRNTPFSEAVSALSLATRTRVHGATSTTPLINLRWRGRNYVLAWAALLADASNGAAVCRRSYCDVWIVKTVGQDTRATVLKVVPTAAPRSAESVGAKPTGAPIPTLGQEDPSAIL